MRPGLRIVTGVLASAVIVSSVAISFGAPQVRGLVPIPSQPIPSLPLPSLPLPTLPLPSLPIPLPTVSLPVPLPTISLPLPSVSLPLPTLSLPLPTFGTPEPSTVAGTPSASPASTGPGSASSSDDPDDADAPGAAGGPPGSTLAGLQDLAPGSLTVPPVAQVPPSLPTVGSWLVPALGAAVPALFIGLLVAAQILTGAAGIRAARGSLDRVGAFVPPWLRRERVAPGEDPGPAA